jgi:glutamyl-tRNA synthetase
VRNYLALLGWGGADDQGVISTQELAERFELERVSRNPAQFDERKLRWMNGLYIRELPLAELAARVTRFVPEAVPVGGPPGEPGAPHAGEISGLDPERFERAVAISQEKIQTLADFWPLAGFLFEDREPEPGAIERWLDEGGRERLRATREALARAPDFGEESVESALDGVQGALGCKAGEIYQPLRVAMAGRSVSPGIFESAALLGREETLRRIDRALRL